MKITRSKEEWVTIKMSPEEFLEKFNLKGYEIRSLLIRDGGEEVELEAKKTDTAKEK
jgi:hypothetical protein